MNPQLDKTANLNLPPSMPEMTVPLPETAEHNADRAAEQQPAVAERNAPPAMALPAQPMPAPMPAAQPVQPANDAQASSTPSTADDNDLIEKEWVAKAKQIIERTREDPYGQSKQISVVKADYMKKRYNKDIKLVEE